MGKSLFVTEKPSVAQAFAKALGVHPAQKNDGFIEDDKYIITWCVGHLVAPSYPEAYGEEYKKWSMDTLPFIPTSWKYEVIKNVAKQFSVVKKLLNRNDINTIYNCGDSAREGELIQRLTYETAGYNKNARMMRVWIDSQTDDEILRGIREAKPSFAYDNLAKAGYMRAKEDYLFGINFSRLLTLLYAYNIKSKLGLDKCFISVGRVMTCVLGMVVQREQEINAFKKTNYYGVKAEFDSLDATWKSVEGSKYEDSLLLYNENGFFDKKDAERLMQACENIGSLTLKKVERKDEKKYAPLLFNLAELQAECTKAFKISPDTTLNAVQALYEGKMVTYPRTDARVLSTAVSKE
ncbi:MAG: type IA DNA topoisomerase, partial [Lachnospiraceae bacterium]|nr:type IA DNA topoisomerase [Lachnospiraceae bacterium]